jgi:two-component system, LytTR family, sensor histidine kinase AlgZ
MARSDEGSPDHNPGRGGAPGRARARRQSEGGAAPVIPDTCNLGIALRVIVPMLAMTVVASLAIADGAADAMWHFGALSSVVVPSVVGSLVLLCALRRGVNGKPFSVQWLIGCGVPAAVTVVSILVVRAVAGPEAPAAPLGWALAGRALVAAAAAWLFIEYFRLRARAFSPSLSEARLQALQARIRPHFLFNSLNAVLGLMRSNPRQAEATLENLADLFRVFMRDASELVALDEEVGTCKEYLAIEQLRIGDRLQIAWNLDRMPGDALVPSLLLQPLVENAVHHGIEPRTDPGIVEITVERLGDRVRVEIANPLATAQPVRSGNQMALSNVRERLMLLYDMEAELKTESTEGRFRLRLEFPYRKERRRRDVRRHFGPDH